MPPAPDAHTFTGHACTIGPEGITFSAPATLAFNLTAEEWSAVYSREKRFVVQCYNQSADAWEEVPTDVYLGTRSVAAGVAHSGLYALFVRAPPDGAGETVATGAVPDPAYVRLIPGLFGLIIAVVAMLIYLCGALGGERDGSIRKGRR